VSGLAAVISFESTPSAEEIERVCAPAAYRAGHGVRTWRCGAAALAHLSRPALPESDTIPQPLLAADGDLAIVFDGRLDAREELASRLGGLRPDAALALEACRRWGTASAAHLLGDFALVAWSRTRQTLYCARDVMGIRPLYYHWSPARFVCASEIAQVLAAPGVTLAPNEGMLGEYLANSIVDRHETVYRGVFRLPAAHWLELRAGAAPVVRRYWQIDPGRSLAYRTDEEYAEHFRTLFLSAVKDRLRACGPVGVYFSGGTDSAAVAAAASAVTDPAARPAGYTLDVGRPEADERVYIEDLARFCGFASHVYQAPPEPWVANVGGRDVHDCLADPAGYPWKQSIAANGARVMLSGHGGDAGFFGSFYHYADLLRRGRLLAFVRQVRGDARTPGSDWSRSSVVQCGAWPLLPPSLRRAFRPAARRWLRYAPVPSWIEPGFAARLDLESRIRPPARDRQGPSAARDDLWRDLESGWNAVYRETAERESARAGLDDRHPFLDRRVVEFAMAIPDDQRWRGTVTRYVVRNALARELSPLSRARTTRADGAARVADAIRSMGDAGLFTRMAVAEAGWVRQPAIDAMRARLGQRRADGDSRYCGDAFPLWIIGGVEAWFRNTFASGYNPAQQPVGSARGPQ
jgi:asparagine synthase (glutamine-hydrolysing)